MKFILSMLMISIGSAAYAVPYTCEFQDGGEKVISRVSGDVDADLHHLIGNDQGTLSASRATLGGPISMLALVVINVHGGKSAVTAQTSPGGEIILRIDDYTQPVQLMTCRSN